MPKHSTTESNQNGDRNRIDNYGPPNVPSKWTTSKDPLPLSLFFPFFSDSHHTLGFAPIRMD